MSAKDCGRSYQMILLIACALMYMIMLGSIKAFGVFYVELLDYYDSGSGNTSWITGLFQFLICIIGPISNRLGVAYTFKTVMFVGGFLAFLGFLLSAFVPRMEYWYLTYGLVAGTGVGLGLAPCLTVVSFHFDKRRSLANSFVVAGSGVGSIVLPYIYTYLIETYYLQGAIMITSAIVLHICVGALLVRQPSQLKPPKSVDQKQNASSQKEVTNNHGNTSDETKPLFYFSLLKNKKFILYLSAFAVNVFAYVTNFTIIPGYAKQIKLSDEQLATTLSVFGGIEVFGRLVIGLLIDKYDGSCRKIIAICCVIGGASSFVIPFFDQFEILISYVLVAGVTTGAFWPLMPRLCLEVYPIEMLPAAQGLVLLSFSIPLLLGQPIAGWIEDVSGTWNMSFRVFGAVYFIAATLYVVEPIFKGKVTCCNAKRSYSTQRHLSEHFPHQYVNRGFLSEFHSPTTQNVKTIKNTNYIRR